MISDAASRFQGDLAMTGMAASVTCGIVLPRTSRSIVDATFIAQLAQRVAWVRAAAAGNSSTFASAIGRQFERWLLGSHQSASVPKLTANESSLAPVDLVIDLSDGETASALSSRAPLGIWILIDQKGIRVDLYRALVDAFLGGSGVIDLQLCRWRPSDGKTECLYSGRLRLRRTIRRTLIAVPASLAGWISVTLRRMALNEIFAQVQISNSRPSPNVSLWRCLWRQAINLAGLIREYLTVEEWNVGIASFGKPEDIVFGFSMDQVRWLPRPKRLTFRADGFGWREGKSLRVVFEEFDYRNGKGTLGVVFTDDELRQPMFARFAEFPEHVSYPFAVLIDGRRWILPEMSETGRGQIFAVNRDGSLTLDGRVLIDLPLVDGTLFRHDDYWWLMGGLIDDEPNGKLHAWYARSPFGPWTAHALNPVKCDPVGSRSAGTPFICNGMLIRPAQDCLRTYGASVVLQRIIELTPNRFREESIGRLHPSAASPYPDGLHTLCMGEGFAIVDGKKFRYSPWAPYLRWRNARGVVARATVR
jgi:hypothetical protein